MPVSENSAWTIGEKEMPEPYSPVSYAEFSNDDLLVRISVPLSGRRQHTVGPCLLPLIPVRRDYRTDLYINIEIQANAESELIIDPGQWTLEIIGPGQDCLDCEETTRTLSPHHIQIKRYTGATDLERMDVGPAVNWNGNADLRLLTITGGDITFHTFTLKNLSFDVNGELVQLPPITFHRKSRMDYTPWTTDALEIILPR